MSRDFRLTVTIDGVDTPVREVRSAGDVDMPVSTGSVTLDAPRPVHVQPNAPITVYAGYDGAADPVFVGELTDDEAQFDDRGGRLTIDLEGPSRRLRWQNEEEIGFTGPLSLNVWWRSMCNWRGMPAYFADDTTDVNGDTLMRGANEVVGGWIPITVRRSPLSDMERFPRLLGYRHFDRLDGLTRLQRVSGLPTEAWEDLPLYEEGVNVLDVRRAQSMGRAANWWDVWGLKYEDEETGEQFVIHSFPASVTPNPQFGPSGIHRAEIRDSDLDTVALADACRNAHEMDYSTRQYRYRWTAVGGDGARQPGDQVAVRSATVNGPDSAGGLGTIIQHLPRALWLMRVEHVISDRGWLTHMEGWAGNGEALPAGDDCATQTLLSGTVHLGNENLWHYRVPSPNGNTSSTEHRIDFSVANNYTTLTIICDAHGTNSFVRNQESTASRYEIWQDRGDGMERVASGEMPRQNENLEQRLPYAQDWPWAEDVVIPLSGNLLAGDAQLRIYSGKDSDVGDNDDYEVKNVRLRTCGIGVPEVIVT